MSETSIEHPSSTTGPDGNGAAARRTVRHQHLGYHWMRLTWHVLQVRLRFLIVLLIAFLVVGKWDILRSYWDRLTRDPDANAPTAISVDTEYFCPMCPGVVSDWPSKCPVCNMTLVRRKRGDATPLPDGVVARMQFSPYRLQLAGIRTAPVGAQRLVREITLTGFVTTDPGQPPGDSRRVLLKADAFERDLPFLISGQQLSVGSQTFPGHKPFVGWLQSVTMEPTSVGPAFRVWVAIENPDQTLRPGVLVTAQLQASVASYGPVAERLGADWRDRTLLGLLQQTLLRSAEPSGALEALVRGAGDELLFRKEQVLAVPETAVIDTGARKVVYVESGPGMFDGVEVVLGPRCGDFYPVIHGLQAGQQVASAGAFLIDAETRLNPSVAVSYFGAARSSAEGEHVHADISQALLQLSPEDQALANRQKVCPVTGQALGSMGKPIRVEAGGKVVFLCCDGCTSAFRRDPQKYLAKLGQQ
jgi:hypothetical protein